MSDKKQLLSLDAIKTSIIQYFKASSLKKKLLIFGIFFLILFITFQVNNFKNRSGEKDQKLREAKTSVPSQNMIIASGKVLDSSKNPIEGAFVSIEGKTAITDKDGVWKAELLSKQIGSILVLANGYEKINKTYSENETITLQESSKTSSTITVLDKENKPVSNAFALYLDSNSYKPKRVQKTNNNGQTSFTNIPKGKGGFLVIMDGYKAGWVVADLKDKDKLTVNLEKQDQISTDIQQASSSAQTQDKNIEIYFDPSLKDKVKYSVVFKIKQDKLYEELKGISSFGNNQSLNNLSIFSSDSKQSLISVDKINTADKEQTDSQIVVFGNSLNDDKIVSSIPLSVVLTKEYLLSITDKNNIISTILKLYSNEQASKETHVVFKTENPKTDETVAPLHDESYLSYAVLSAKPEQKSDWYEYQSRDCLEDFDIPLYKPHGRVVLDSRYFSGLYVICEYDIERDKSEVIGEGKTKVVTNSIIGWYKKTMEGNGWTVTPDKDIIQSIMSPRSQYIPAEFKKCEPVDKKTWEVIDLVVYEGIVPERYGIFKEQPVYKLMFGQRKLFSPSGSDLEYYGCSLENPTSTSVSTPMPTTKPFSVPANIPKTGCFDTDGGEEAGIQAGARKGFDNPLVKGRVYVDGKDYTVINGKKVINEDSCVGSWVKEYICSRSYSGKLSWAAPYTSYCPVSNTSCRDGACLQRPSSPAPKMITTGCSNSYGGMCIDCERPPSGFTGCQTSGLAGSESHSCPENNTCVFYKDAQFNPNTFEWEFK